MVMTPLCFTFTKAGYFKTKLEIGEVCKMDIEVSEGNSTYVFTLRSNAKCLPLFRVLPFEKPSAFTL